MSSQVEIEKPEERQEPEENQEDRAYITLEGKIVCEGCIKADVCEILKSVVRLGSYAQDFESNFSVKVELSASIYECEHKVSDNIEIDVGL